MARTRKPRFKDLTPEQIAEIDNGVGPTWLPPFMRQSASKLLSFRVNGNRVDWYPPEAQVEHDFGYSVGGDVMYRHECDLLLLKNMQKNFKKNLPANMQWHGLLVADASYILLRFHGVSSFYFYGKNDPVPTINEVIKRAKGEESIEGPLWKKLVPIISIPLGLLTLMGIIGMFIARQVLLTLSKLGKSDSLTPRSE